MQFWETEYEGHTIRVENAWTGERLFVDGELQDEQQGWISRSRLWGHIPGKDRLHRRIVKVSLGGMFTVECRVFVDDKLCSLSRGK